MSTNNTKNHPEVFTALALLVKQIFKKKVIFSCLRKIKLFSKKNNIKLNIHFLLMIIKAKKLIFKPIFKKYYPICKRKI